MGSLLKTVGACFLGSATGAALVISMWIIASANAQGATAGDWLNFAAVVFGVCATIGGTLAVDRLQVRYRHTQVVKQLAGALSEWTISVGKAEEEITPARIADLRQQLAYIEVLTDGIRSDRPSVRMGLHAFTFHAPAMIEKLALIGAEGITHEKGWSNLMWFNLCGTMQRSLSACCKQSEASEPLCGLILGLAFEQKGEDSLSLNHS